MYGPWLIGTRPKKKLFSRMNGEREKGMPKPDRNPRRTWFDIMNVVREQKDGEQHDDPNMEDTSQRDRLLDDMHNNVHPLHEQHMEGLTEMEITHLRQNQQNNIEPYPNNLQYKPTQDHTIDLNTLPPETTITPYHHRHSQDTSTPAPHSACSFSIQQNILPAQQNPYWKVQSNKIEPNTPHRYIQVILKENITYPLIDELPDQPISPTVKEKTDNTYFVEIPQKPHPQAEMKRARH